MTTECLNGPTDDDERADELQDDLQRLPMFREDSLANADSDQMARLVSATNPANLWTAMEFIVSRNVELSVTHRLGAAPRATRCDVLESLIREYTPSAATGTANTPRVGAAFSQEQAA